MHFKRQGKSKINDEIMGSELRANQEIQMPGFRAELNVTVVTYVLMHATEKLS
jgi:hypothetical protein